MKAVRMVGVDGDPVDVPVGVLEALAAELDGWVLEHGEPGFDEAVQIWNAMASRTPAVVVQPVSSADVSKVVAFAAARGLLVSIKGGGHNIAGTSLTEGGLTLDMSRLRSVQVDVERRVAAVGAGCRLGDVDRATQVHGLATVLGAVSRTGAAGLTLGGGFGYLSRRFGWAVDNLEEVEIVTADGAVLRAADGEHDDLFWALRGGGGNFGVVTRFTFSLYDVGPQVTGGLIAWDAEKADEVSSLYREICQAAPRELTLMLVMRRAPRTPVVPEHWHGRPIVSLVVCHTGTAERARDDLAAIRSLPHPVVDLLGPMRYVDVQSMLDASQPDGMHNYWKSEFLPELADGVLRGFVEHGGRITSPMSQAILFQLGGAVAEREPSATSFGNRDAAHVFFAAGCWAPSAPDAGAHVAWARSAWEAMRPYSTGGNYINVQTADEDDSRTREAYRDSHQRLAEVKASYDPHNLFRVNRNISPATASAVAPANRETPPGVAHGSGELLGPA